jgi:hypothetical protein
MELAQDLLGGLTVQGRITCKQLPRANRCIPGISKFHGQQAEKPMTFLQLLWDFEGERLAAKPLAAPIAKRKSR